MVNLKEKKKSWTVKKGTGRLIDSDGRQEQELEAGNFES